MAERPNSRLQTWEAESHQQPQTQRRGVEGHGGSKLKEVTLQTLKHASSDSTSSIKEISSNCTANQGPGVQMVSPNIWGTVLIQTTTAGISKQ